MSRSLNRRSETWRHVCLTLAMVAVAMKVLVPAGFMTRATTNDLPFAIVLCTAEGVAMVEPGGVLPGHTDDRSDQTASHEVPCAFAGHGVSAPAPNLLDIQSVEFMAFQVVAPPSRPDLTPGRGLAAPPLPARGPPTLLT